jgi:uncharacterized protein
LPGIIEGAKDGKGRGRQVIGVARTCTLILIVLDVMKPLIHKKVIENELEGFGIRLNKRPPDIRIKKKLKGGVNITKKMGVVFTHLTEKAIIAVLYEYKIKNCDIKFMMDATVDNLVDVCEGNRIYVPCVYVWNKCELISQEQIAMLERHPLYVPVSAKMNLNFGKLKELIWERLALIRVYTKPKGKEPNFDEPVILPSCKSTVIDFCEKISK